MRRFKFEDINDETFDAAAACETPEEVRQLFAGQGFDLSEETAKKLFDSTRFVELEDDEAAMVAGGGCGGSDDSDSSPSPDTECDPDY